MSGNNAFTWVGVAGFEPAASSSRTKDGAEGAGTGAAVTSESVSQDATSHPIGIPAPDAPVTHAAGDIAASLPGLADLINGRIGAWHDYGYADPPTPDHASIPPLGERSAGAVYNGHQAVRDIDEMIRQLHALRGQLVSELRQDEDIRAVRVDAMLAERRPDQRSAALAARMSRKSGGAR